MKHRQKIRKFGRRRNQRQALLKNLAAHLILKERITTTEEKAKEIRPFVEKLITKGKSAMTSREQSASGQDGSPPKADASPERASKGNGLAAVRYLTKYLPVKARQKLISQISPRYQKRNGGYARIIKLGPRRTDGAKMAIIELVE
ncbi:MAG: 50S ribosomal protein L17 [Candidatus Portnoybacteria bacterium CG03_land_8_20_14_0_80_41_10]|uniref:Large ribosomal subunit protein bL17 n=1 Tax=Candidatus Portnoybacteria bacterium CG03_land_8_20_14_0_80_41_10 TaxID=1974808 RepID=A0A2M7BV22_9BACT|nr:MAG: 50S ribosomal protein L17 [Candidatus Portnoybacteria bacterium CG03_land_8_20_14_0_80_41_10]